MLSNRIFNLGLRAFTLLGKFLLIFFISRFLSAADVGLYGLVVAAISYTLYFIGFDFYTFSTRDLLKQEKARWGQLLKSQGAFFLIMYCIILPLSLFLFVFDFLPWSVLAWFFILLVLEHINQELGRFLVIISEQTTASIVLFLRSGAWCIITIALFMLFPNLRSLDIVFLSWIFGSILASLFGILKCARNLDISGWKERIDWGWIKQGLKVVIPFLLGTLALRGIYTIDRFWFEYLVSRDILGAYILFIGICGALMSFLDAGVFMYSYPILIKKHYAYDREGFYKELKKLTTLTISLSLFFIFSTFIVLPYLLEWIGNPIYSENQSIFWLLLASTIAYIMSMIPHYALYAKGINKHIVISHILGFIVFLISIPTISYFDTMSAIPIALIFSFLFILIYKLFFLIKLA